MELTYLITALIILIIIVIILLIVFTKSNTKITTFTSNNPEKIKEMLEKHNFPTDMLEKMKMSNGNIITTSQTTRTVKYVNGQIVSDETSSSNKEYSPLTNCPNCGAKLEHDTNGICKYCNTSLNTYQIKQ